MATAGEAGSTAARLVGGHTAELVMVAVIATSTAAALNGTILCGARLGYSMALDGAFWLGASRLHRRRRVPTRALWVQAAWSCVLALSEGFQQILSLVGVAMVVCGSMTVASLFVLRRKRPNLPRPYRAMGYPIVPAAYIALAALVMLDLLVLKPRYSWPGLIIVAAGVPVFYWWRRRAPDTGHAATGP